MCQTSDVVLPRTIRILHLSRSPGTWASSDVVFPCPISVPGLHTFINSTNIATLIKPFTEMSGESEI